MWGFDDITQTASGLFHRAESAVEGAVSGGGLAAHAGGEHANSASNAVTGSSNFLQRGLDWAAHGLEHGIPTAIRGGEDRLTRALGGTVDNMSMTNTAVGFGGGLLSGVSQMAGGLVNMAAHPLNTLSGLGSMAAHAIPGLGHTGAEDGEFWGRVGSGFTRPYREAIDSGHAGEAAGMGVANLASFFVGGGEANAADASRAADISVEALISRGDYAGAVREIGSGGAETAANVAADANRAADIARFVRPADGIDALTELGNHAGAVREIASGGGEAVQASQAANTVQRASTAAQVTSHVGHAAGAAHAAHSVPMRVYHALHNTQHVAEAGQLGHEAANP